MSIDSVRRVCVSSWFAALALGGCVGSLGDDAADVESVEHRLDVTAAPYILELSGITASQKTIIGGFAGASIAPPHRIMLADGNASDDAIIEWYEQARSGGNERRSGTVTCLDQDLNSVVAIYELEGVRPRALTGSDDGIHIERLELVVDVIERIE